MATGYVYEPIYLEHNLRGHPENRERLKTILKVLDEYGMRERLTSIPAVPISMERLERCHSRGYIDQVKRVAQRGGGASGHRQAQEQAHDACRGTGCRGCRFAGGDTCSR